MKNNHLIILFAMLISMAASVVFVSCGDDEDEVTPGGGNGNAPSGVTAVNLGLPSGTLWANMNVGASTPEAPGNYFAWGETEPLKTDFSWSTYKWYNKSGNKLTKYCTTDNLTELELADDAAYVNWGKQWRMPTQEQFEELRAECTWVWTPLNDMKGYKVVGQNGNFIFLPAAGCRDEASLNYAGSRGYYWSRTLSTSGTNGAWGLDFGSGYVNTYNYGGYRCNGRSVRPVRLSE